MAQAPVLGCSTRKVQWGRAYFEKPIHPEFIPWPLQRGMTGEPATPRNPNCPKCGTGMRLFGIEPDAPGLELLTFECPKCLHIETKLAKID